MVCGIGITNISKQAVPEEFLLCLVSGFVYHRKAIGVSRATLRDIADTIERQSKEARYFQGAVITWVQQDSFVKFQYWQMVLYEYA